MTRLSLITAAAVLPAVTAFAPIAPASKVVVNRPGLIQTPLFAEEDKSAEAVFVAPEESVAGDEDVTFAKAESLGRGAAKVSSFD